jgi:hypothetical protein
VTVTGVGMPMSIIWRFVPSASARRCWLVPAGGYCGYAILEFAHGEFDRARRWPSAFKLGTDTAMRSAWDREWWI